ncbi:MAG: RDD family protein [Acidobacteriia bacterium]|nr:RDD family protein [Terriglobia bacterium]
MMNAPAPNPLPGALADKLTIDTPEQTALEFAIAGIGSRFLALAVDTLIQIVTGLTVMIGSGLLLSSVPLPFVKGSVWYVALLILFFFLLYFGYFAFFEAIWNGQTPGKRYVGIRVIKDSGRPLTPAESVARNLLRIVDQMPGFYAVGMASVVLSRQNKRLGDFVAGTIVVHEKALEELRPLWQAPQAAGAVRYGAAALSTEEFALVESFLNRREALAPDVRHRLAMQIAGQIKPKLTLPDERLISNEKLLEAVAYERRSAARYG